MIPGRVLYIISFVSHSFGTPKARRKQLASRIHILRSSIASNRPTAVWSELTT